MKDPADMTDDERFAIAFAAGCRIKTGDARIDGDNYRFVMQTEFPVTIAELNGRYVVYEARGIRGR